MTIEELNKKYNTNIPEAVLPDEIGNPEKWEKEGRARMKEILQREEYGRFPEFDKNNVSFKVVSNEPVLMMEKVIRKEVKITIKGKGGEHTYPVSIFLPAGKKNVPTFLYINRLEWMRRCVIRGTINQRLPIEEVTDRGYGLAFFCTDDISSEMLDTGVDYKKGLHNALCINEKADDNLGSIGLWSFAAMRIMDYFETDEDIDNTKVAVVGHSRLGKTALLTGAFDERFAITISNDSGAGGAALFKTKVGEHVEFMVNVIPYWFCKNYRKYYNAEEKMEFDQHFLLSLVAPRALYVGSASLDEWSDPNAEFQSTVLASEVYEKVYGIKGLGTDVFPENDKPIHGENVAYHVRTGPHNILRPDWDAYMDFADKTFSK